jgi:tRNA modification GTPase
MMVFDTIAAIATAQGPGAVAIVRLSGPDALAIADRIYRTMKHRVPSTLLSSRPSHGVFLGWLYHPVTEQIVDQALVLLMRAPNSFTGEDVVEFQVHGGAAPTRVLGLILSQGARLAAPGEFTKRAFLNGRLDLTQAEAIGDVVSAHSERALQVALNQLDGQLAKHVLTARQHLTALLARLEAAIDFPDEVDDVSQQEALHLLDEAARCVGGLLATAQEGQILREGLALAIVGRPNAGKSSLLNALLGRERAIVTDIAGTTRDVLEESLQLGGVWFRIVDTAGIRETEDKVEAMGVARSRVALEQADVVLLVCDLDAGIDAREKELLAAIGDRPGVIVGNKLDTVTSPAVAYERLASLGGEYPVALVAAPHGEGVPGLGAVIVQAALQGSARTSATAINARHRRCLESAQACVSHAREASLHGLPADFIAIDVKAAIAGLCEMTGDAIAEDVIEEVFRSFCVGK